ncbi:unnamed protein product [Trifolium pratense]|uniref:Uncharacterized protein n=1 Tax=Trifolium pratense TaxID=57577 RepID=A0ACB0LE60_TRIPR|nr:unnamed protein product [Trifolium pratense]
MECNKDEATRAKEIAERKFIAKDISGAKKFALKAQNLYPSLEGIPQMIAKIDVYISAENKVKGEADLYGILGVDPRADDDTVRKQTRTSLSEPIGPLNMFQRRGLYRPGAPLNFNPKPDHQGPHKSKSNAGKNMAAPNVGAGSNKNSFQWAPFSNSSISNVAQAANVVQQAYHKVKRDREEAQATTEKEEALRRKQNVSKKGYGKGNPAKRKRRGMEGNGASNSTRDLSAIELQNLLIEKARKEIRKQLNEFQSNTVDKSVA